MIGWGWFAWIVLGGLAGWIASKIMKVGRILSGFFMNIILGVAGALFGGWILSHFIDSQLGMWWESADGNRRCMPDYLDCCFIRKKVSKK